MKSVKDRDRIRSSGAPVAEVMSFEASSVRIRLRFWHPSDEASEYAAIDAAAKAVYAAYDSGTKEFAFSQQTPGGARRKRQSGRQAGHRHLILHADGINCV